MAVYTDIDIELTKAVDGDITIDEEIEAVKNSLANIMQTFQGSRRMIPEFAINIYSMLFEPMSDEISNIIGSAILEAITQWDDRIIISNVNIDANYDANLYTCTINFNTISTQEIHTVDFVLKRN